VKDYRSTGLWNQKI